jgi:gas vesicle protein
MARERVEVIAGLLTGALLGATLALALSPSNGGTRERLRSLAREAEAEAAQQS